MPAYGATPTATPVRDSHETRERLAGTDFAALAELLGIAAACATTYPTAPFADPHACEGPACRDGEEVDAEFVATHRATNGVFTYRTPLCRGCLPPHLAALRHAAGVDAASIRVEVPTPIKAAR